MNIKQNFIKTTQVLGKAEDGWNVAIRLVLSYGFYTPAMMKLSDIHAIADWFAEMGLPAPLLNAYLATGTELAGVILLPLGLGTRFIAIPLIITMIVAIATVHWANGFEAGNNGFEIPFYYLLFLTFLLIKGSGKWSIDFLIKRKLVA